MKIEYTGIYINGAVSFDVQLNLPENTPVVVRVAATVRVLPTKIARAVHAIVAFVRCAATTVVSAIAASKIVSTVRKTVVNAV